MITRVVTKHHPLTRIDGAPIRTRSGRRHCWVRGSPSAPGPHPGLVIEWQQRDGVWFALVAYIIEADRVLVEQWLSAELLTGIG